MKKKTLTVPQGGLKSLKTHGTKSRMSAGSSHTSRVTKPGRAGAGRRSSGDTHKKNRR